jgi:hypothetical protein
MTRCTPCPPACSRGNGRASSRGASPALNPKAEQVALLHHLPLPGEVPRLAGQTLKYHLDGGGFKYPAEKACWQRASRCCMLHGFPVQLRPRGAGDSPPWSALRRLRGRQPPDFRVRRSD